MGWKGVRDPLYIYGLCRPGGSGVVKWSRAPEPSLNIKYITDSGNQGRRGREVGRWKGGNSMRWLRSETDQQDNVTR